MLFSWGSQPHQYPYLYFRACGKKFSSRAPDPLLPAARGIFPRSFPRPGSKMLPNNSMTNPKKKQPCRCTHGKSIHRVERDKKGNLRHPCYFPDCKCTDYKPTGK